MCDVENLAAERAAKSGGKARKTLLPSPAPPPGSPREEVAEWLTVALALGADHVVAAERYGRHMDARLVLVLASGQRVTFDRAADAFDVSKLAQVVMIATGAQVPPYQRADVLQIAGSIIRLSELLAEADARGEAAEWGRTFLAAAAPNTLIAQDFATPAGRWEALNLLLGFKLGMDLPPYATAAERAAIVLDGATGDRMVRTSAFGAHVRGMAGHPIKWAALHGRMVEVSWQHCGELQQRQPGGTGKAKAHVYIVPAEWDS